MTMRVAVVTPVFLPYRSGMSQVAAQEAAGLAARGHDVTVFTPDYGCFSAQCHSERSEESHSCQRKRFFGLWPQNDKPNSPKLRYVQSFFKFGNAAWLPQLARELKNFEVVHLHYPFFGAVAAVLLANKPLAITYHMDVIGRGFIRPIFQLYTKFVLPRLLTRAKKVIVSTMDYAKSSALAPFLAQEPDKFVEIMFGVDTERFAPAANQKQPEKLILFVAALDRAHYFKGLDLLLNAFYNLQPTTYNLVVIGDGDWRPHYEALARRLGIADQVTFVGTVNDEELLRYYQKAEILTVPSLNRSEAFSLSALQALSCGLPVVASDLPGLRQVVGERGLLFPPGDVAALTDALKRLLSNDNLRSQLSQLAKSVILNQSAIKKEIDKLEVVLFDSKHS